jgi:hypothetical protein
MILLTKLEMVAQPEETPSDIGDEEDSAYWMLKVRRGI